MPAATLSQLPRTSLDRPGRNGRAPSPLDLFANRRPERGAILIPSRKDRGRDRTTLSHRAYPHLSRSAAPSQACVSEVYLFGRECCPSASWDTLDTMEKYWRRRRRGFGRGKTDRAAHALDWAFPPRRALRAKACGKQMLLGAAIEGL